MIATLEIADRFETAGFAREQARALASALAASSEAGREDVATKRDLIEMEARRINVIDDLGQALG